MAVTKIEFIAKDVKELTKWLKRFSIIEKSILIELDEINSCFIAKTHNEERSVVKMGSINFDVCGLITKKPKDPKRIKMGIYSLSQLIKILEHFNVGEFNLIINYDELISDTGTDFAVTSIAFKNSNLKMTIENAPLSIFKYIPDDLFKKQIAQLSDNDKAITFTIKDLNEITSLCNMDDDFKFIDMTVKDGKYVISGKIFNKLISDSCSKEIESNITMYKDQYSKLDIENYDFIFGDDRLVCKSNDSDTVTVISGVEKTELDEKKDEDTGF